LLIVMYDEHGGFFDHVEPPPAVPPDDATPSEDSFTRLGVRVPAILVSPWTGARVETTQFDHTSVLKYLTEKWQLGPLGRRTAAATSIGIAIHPSAPRMDYVERIELSADQLSPPNLGAEDKAFDIPNAHQSALRKLADYLKMDAVEKVPKVVSILARAAEAVRSAAQYVLERALEEPPGFKVSIAEPDKLARPADVTARDEVARFIMRAKRYAAKGINDRLSDTGLAPEQQQHAVQTLSLITGRSFQLEGSEQVAASAKVWLDAQQRPTVSKPVK